MTKFSDDLIKEVKDYYNKNKNKIIGEVLVKSAYKKDFIKKKKFSAQDLADHFGLTISQAKRMLHVK